ncbi:hypothetical protein ACSCBZ_24880 [Streptomyces niveiscabiei]|uniref:hypothetical protein n=1 Tax=Streptomyces niveiscabiei TaxID=164115 RepID=UPI0006EBD8E2|nr:hypothetical protein [Streptomyces niveiscabiei]
MTAEATTGVASVDMMVAWAVGITALGALAALLWRLLRAVLRIADLVDEIREDWLGAPERPGVPARPGVMVRLGEHDERLTDHETRITRVETRIPDGT